MYIIALTGPHNTGKTTTMNMLYKWLCVEANITQKRRPIDGVTNDNDPTEDFEAKFEYKGKKVVLYSMGDNKKILCNAIDKYKGEYDVFICALSTDKGMHHGIKAKYDNKNGTKYTTVPKTLNGGPKLIADYYDMRRLIQRLDCVIENK